MLTLFQDAEVVPDQVLIDLGEPGEAVVDDNGRHLIPAELLDSSKPVETSDQFPSLGDHHWLEQALELDADCQVEDLAFVQVSEPGADVDRVGGEVSHAPMVAAA